MRKRNVDSCAPDHECTDEEINAIFVELMDVRNDESIIRYEFPSVEEMLHIVEVAEAYDGEWYHSDVTLSGDTEISEEHTALKRMIEALGKDAGIFLSHSYELDEETEKALAARFKK